MPSILVEMGFISNTSEANKLQDDNYRNKIAQGVVNGVVKFFNN
jgi:N-acetylmuramoyl-L-alanine amidase